MRGDRNARQFSARAYLTMKTVRENGDIHCPNTEVTLLRFERQMNVKNEVPAASNGQAP